MIELINQGLVFNFPKVHKNATCTISFQRTLRIPDDNQAHYLPPSLGNFPLDHVDDFEDKLPSAWKIRGGVMLPMYQSEAMWINFKVWGNLILTFLFVFAQMPFLSRYIELDEQEQDGSAP